MRALAIVLSLATLLFAVPGASALDTGLLGDGPGGACDGLVVDVMCEDPTPTCPEGCYTYRHCHVWITYLDMTWYNPAPGVACEDQPYSYP